MSAIDNSFDMVEVSYLTNTSDDECVSVCVDSPFDESEYVAFTSNSKSITDSLATAGPEGVAAAAAIASTRKKKRPHIFETDPSIRKRQQNKLVRKLKQTIDEFATRVGQQAIVVIASPGAANSFKVFGAKPLESVVRNLQLVILEKLNKAIAEQTPPPVAGDPNLFELPPLVIDGIPTPVEKMTQAQLRAFIPLMLKYSLRRGKPGWGRESFRPPWWPSELPWANVRMDARSEHEKVKSSWTKVLRQIVINCYTYHGREDLLPECGESDLSMDLQTKIKTESPTVLQTITNSDGTLSIIQMDTDSSFMVLPDGATLRHLPVYQVNDDHGYMRNEDTPNNMSELSLEGNSITEATLNSDGQLILTGEDGQAYPVLMNQIFGVPLSSGAYQNVVGSLQDGSTFVQLPNNYPQAVCDQQGNIVIELDKFTNRIKLGKTSH